MFYMYVEYTAPVHANHQKVKHNHFIIYVFIYPQLSVNAYCSEQSLVIIPWKSTILNQ